jgi:hypothetical protein
MKAKTVQELRLQAKRLGLTGYSGLRKEELIKLLADHRRRSAQSTLATQDAKQAKRQPGKISASKKGKATVRSSGGRKAASAKLPPAPLAADTEQQVESAKYAFAPRDVRLPEPAHAADLGEDIDRLPPIQEPLLCLLPQKPGILHGYWALPADPGGAPQPLVLRLIRAHDDRVEILEEIALAGQYGHRYFHLDPKIETGTISLQLGHYQADGRFVIAIDRGIARIPSLYASELTDRRWRVSETQFRAMYHRAGGFIQDRRLGWSGSFSSR